MAEKQCNLLKNGGGTKENEMATLLDKVATHTPVKARKYITEAYNVDLLDPWGTANEPGYITNTTQGCPSDCALAVREVMSITDNHCVCRLTGLTTSNTIKVWVAVYNNGSWVPYS